MADGLQTAAFGAGCFWGVESNFRQIPGVVDAKVGYMGGTLDNPTYEDVCTDRTGHAEVVELQYDPKRVSYDQLLDAFWKLHDPTQLNRQGPDYGTQYRSAIFYFTPEQKAEAERSKAALQASGHYRKPVVTEITPATKFYEAEDYHQRYFEKRGIAPTCHI
ncbi:MAG: peptide-methionine (S)-S-oxide reductase MsrA [Candidatus Eremiobacteraeota bacterium]|nr:peptide-methionine (S)-S-oxide reductase MsrA [Candidatus Eremiobacteraeota bacterium]MBV8222179.1 peptide-methionine (S)-S-oxide reductase MsrA [Candidatus Eremiobacteraeota bacterium]MBV8281038.1 peptide-methionine (S)-S-oxide reductase MsrA [Candidatus Eremiobacteraeota bacterium]